MGIYSCKLNATLSATGVEDVAPVAMSVVVTHKRVKGGQSEGTTDKRKYNNSKAAISSKNEIADIYFTKKKAAGKKRLKCGCLEEIIAEVKETNKLTDDIIINKALIRQRVKQNLFVGTGHGGTSSPLPMIEVHIVDMLIILARMRESLSPTQCIHSLMI